MAWKKIAEKGEVASGKGKAFKIDGKQIAIFNQDGYHALDDLCVHQDGSIAPGKLDGDIVECPLHFWHYNIKTGELTDYLKDVKLETYPVEARDDGNLRRYLVEKICKLRKIHHFLVIDPVMF